MEEFKKVAPDYDVNTSGVVRSWKSGEPIVMSPKTDKKGYLDVNLAIDGNAKMCLVHRLVAQAFIPNPENKPCVNHINGIKTDNRVENLEWVTHAENTRHAVDTGLIAQGEDSCNAKLTNEQAAYIRDNPDGLTGVELSKMFSVAPKIICKIQLGKTYKSAGGAIREANKHPNRKLSDDVRAEIRRLYAQGGIGQRKLAEKFGVSQATVWNIIHEED